MTEFSNNRRQHVRIYRNFILTYGLVSNPLAQKEVSQINNISQGGMNFSVTEPLKVAEVLTIELKTPFLAESVYLQGEILECREKISQLIYEIRLKFIDPSAAAKEILVKIEQLAPKED